jgi:hypothetical protein
MNRRAMLKTLLGITAVTSIKPSVVPPSVEPRVRYRIDGPVLAKGSEANELIKRLVDELQSLAVRGTSVPFA